MQVEVINKSKNELPEYQTPGSAGMDLRCDLDREVMFTVKSRNVTRSDGSHKLQIDPLGRCLVPTGLFLALPEGYEAQVRPRSGLAIKKGLSVLNSPGTIDADYRGEIMVELINFSDEMIEIEDSERIAQLIITKISQLEWIQVDLLNETERADRGIGHTGTK